MNTHVCILLIVSAVLCLVTKVVTHVLFVH